MGANYSTTNNLSKDGFRHTIDYIATYYIVTMDFESLKKLTDVEYCNQLIILTSDIISKYATTRDIQYMVNKQSGDPELKTTKVTYFSKNMIDREIPPMVKKEMCMSIASFYVRIAHLFSAIILTINPIYKYREQNGTLREVNWANRKDIPDGVEVNVEYSNLCNNRINALEPNAKTQKDGGLVQSLSFGDSTITLQPSICHLQFRPNLLIDEPGIKELEALYYDVYDYNEGKYNSMSPSSMEQYIQDVHEFYKSFTGKHNQEVPVEIKSFSDIPIKQYSKCNNPDYTSPVSVSSSNSIYQKYAENLNEMKRYASINQDKLMEVINKIFVYNVNKQTKKKQIRINPRLNDALLDNLIQQSRTYISQLYLTCQQSYDKGVHLYQDIVESIISKTLDKRIENTENEEYEEMNNIATVASGEPDYVSNPNNNSPQYIPSQIDTQPPTNEYTQQPSRNGNEYAEKPMGEYDEYTQQPPRNGNEYAEKPMGEYDEYTQQPSRNGNEYAEKPMGEYDEYAEKPMGEYDEYAEKPMDEYNEYAEKPMGEYDEYAEKPTDEYNEYAEKPTDEYNEYAEKPTDEYNEYAEKPTDEYEDYTEHQINNEKPVEYISSQNDYKEPYQPDTDKYSDNMPTIYTNRDKYNDVNNISVSSVPYAKTQRSISDRDVTEQLNKIEFGR